MTEKEEKKEKKKIGTYQAKILDELPKVRTRVFVKVAINTLLIIIGFVSAGYLFDYYSGTKPIGTFVSLALSYPVTAVLLRRRMRNYAIERFQDIKAKATKKNRKNV